MVETQAGLPLAGNLVEYSVSEISGKLKRLVEDSFGQVRVRGEISGFRGAHSSGHCYFTLKDERARLEAVIWRTTLQRIKQRPEEGLEVIATGRLTTFPGSSKYQIVVEALEPAGAGALMVLLEERKRKLAAEGLFEATRKKKLPHMPGVIGVITSPTGAVIRDVLHRIAARFPLHVLVWPVRVQGDTCAAEVAAAIAGFNALSPGGAMPRPDLLIVARGGGSIEDLWGFNEEIVVRAVAASTIPLISAIGHETDWTLIDLVADLRAPTPTGAAEIAVPVRAELEARRASLAARLSGSTLRQLQRARAGLDAAIRGLGRPDTLLQMPAQKLNSLANRLRAGFAASLQGRQARFVRAQSRLNPSVLESRVVRTRARLSDLHHRARSAQRARLADHRHRLATISSALTPRRLDAVVDRGRTRLEAAWRLATGLGPQSVLQRGYALVRRASGEPVTETAMLAAGERFVLQMRDGAIDALALKDGAASKPAERPQKAQATIRPGDRQGDLF